METFFSILSALLVFVTMIAGVWMLALPAGIVLVVLKSLKKVHYTWRKILIVGFGGLGLLISAFILFFLLNLIAAFFGINISQITLPESI